MEEGNNVLKVPDRLIQYVDFEEGEILSVNLPDELKDDFEEFKACAQKSMGEELADY